MTPYDSERIPMQDAPSDQLDFFGAASPESSIGPEMENFRLMGDRRLAPTWRQRAADNIIAIRTAEEIVAAGRPATETERAKLIKFVGFGASELANSIFTGKVGEFRKGYEAIGKSLGNIVSATELASLRQATQYAHYTPEYIVRAMWKGLRQLGFTGGAILEPGCGVGIFFALMPEGIASRSSILGVERDPVTAKIARLLYPEADIQEADFTKAILPSGFDLAIGNPPFKNMPVRGDDEIGKLHLSLHDYFVARSIERLRPGGLAAFVVSRYTMDKTDTTARRFIAERADLLGAIRMPEAAMRADAGTDVVVDILFFQKRDEAAPADQAWISVAPCGLEIEGNPVWINQHFIDNPAAVLGDHAITSSQFGPAYTCKPKGMALDILLSGAVGSLPSKVYSPASIDRRAEPTRVGPRVQVGRADEGARVKEGSYIVDGGTLYQIIDGRPLPVEVKSGRGTAGIFPKHAQVIRDLIPIRDAIRDVLRAQEANEDWDVPQQNLNAVYDAFVGKCGPINTTTISERIDPVSGEGIETYRYPNLAPFRDDPDCYLVASIENYDQDTDAASKGPIFTQRVLMPPPEVSITSAADALAVVLNERGRVDMTRIAELLDKAPDEAVRLLGDTVYLDPAADEWVTSDAYLSGKVREKLDVARKAAASEPRFERNVKALEGAQPVDLLPSDITARLGTPWIPADIISAFCREVLGVSARIHHTPAVGVWSVPVATFKGLAASTTDWGTARRHAGHILLDALTGAVPQIWDEWEDLDGTKHRQINPKETQAARDKLVAMQEAFASWVWKDSDRSDLLCGIYNREWNNLVPRAFNGDHLLLPGASSVVQLRPHQKRGTWRMIVAGSTYLAHTVGAGKTLCIIAAIMEQKRLGLITKPIVAVPGHTLTQWSREFLMLYPNAKILVADEENFAKDKRLRFVARAALGNWDAIIITHSAFKMISVPRDFEEELLSAEMAIYQEALQIVDTSDRLSVKKIEAQKENLKSRLDALKARKDDMLTISEMGVDQIYYDEAQTARKLSFATNTTNMKGVDPNGSQTAWDLYVKSKFIATKRPGRALNLASGTPITNTMGEMYTLLRFMNESALVERHIQFFDAWAGAFGQTNTELELQASGFYKPVTRFSRFVNIPELTTMFRDVADVVLSEDLREFVSLPNIRGGERKVKTYDSGPAFKEYQRLLATRIKVIENRHRKPEKGDDIILSVIGDGRHAAIDLRMVDPWKDMAMLEATSAFERESMNLDVLSKCHERNYENKLNGLIDNAFSIWRKTTDYRYRDPATGDFFPLSGAAQMIFSDLGTEAVAENRGLSAYTEIVRRLTDLGVPRWQIAIMQHYKKAAAKQRLFSDVNAGRVRFLIGSSQTMGTGVNAQLRLVALHHLDVPWLPSDVEQREGRIIRQGNQNDEIQIYCYATLGSMDATMWQTVERKSRFIDAVLRGDKSIRTLEDLEADQASQFAMAKALASGDDRLMRKAGLEADIARLERKRSAHYDSQANVRRQITWAKEEIARREGVIVNLEADMLTRAVPTKEDFSMVVEGETFTDIEKAGEALMLSLNTAAMESAERRWNIGEFGGFTLKAHGWTAYNFRTKKPEYRLTVDVLCNYGKPTVYDQDLRQGQFLIRRISDVLQSFEGQLFEARDAVSRNQAIIEDYSKRTTNAPFELQAELDKMVGELRDLDKELEHKEEALALEPAE